MISPVVVLVIVLGNFPLAQKDCELKRSETT
jgi:hypothetical protein